MSIYGHGSQKCSQLCLEGGLCDTLSEQGAVLIGEVGFGAIGGSGGLGLGLGLGLG